MRRLSSCLLLSLIACFALGARSPQVPIDGAQIPQFAQRLPTLSVDPFHGTMTTVAGSAAVTLRMCEFRASVLPASAVSQYDGTWVWGYLADPAGNATCPELVALYGGASGIVDTYVGPVVVNQRGVPTLMTYINDLPSTISTNLPFYRYATDQTIHWADPMSPQSEASPCTHEMTIPPFGAPCAENYSGTVPATVHLHGGEVPPELDGGPDTWFSSDGLHHGARYYSALGGEGNRVTYRYPNAQQAAPIWIHDHALGLTRLNVYAGLAGAYFIDDASQQLPQNLPPTNEVIPLVLQDRMFDEQGQLYFPASAGGGSPNPNHPYWIPEFLGDTIVVNGKAWPYLEVEPRRYRFLLLNGSNSRAFELSFGDRNNGARGAPAIWVLGTDGGYLDVPARAGAIARPRPMGAMTQRDAPLLIMPGERYNIEIDFGGLTPGMRLLLRNTANAPYPSGDPVDPTTTARVLEFRITECSSGKCGVADASYDPSSRTPLRRGSGAMVRLADPRTGMLAHGVRVDATRLLTLNEVLADGRTAIDPVTGQLTEYEGGPLEILLNNTEWMGESDRASDDFVHLASNGVNTAVSETPLEGNTEVWEIVNLTADAHPIHLHLAQFQLLNRQPFDVDAYSEMYEAAFPSRTYEQGYGPPYDYRADRNPRSGGKSGGNPDVAPFLLHPLRRPAVYEAGWKDTAVAFPREVTRLVVRWAPTDLPVNALRSALAFPFDPTGEGGRYLYVWHCHILDHEDNEMMRPTLIEANPEAIPRRILKGRDY
jgi:FtsP/CotA-like multicopper oxidase with cupredoxin domain